MQLIKFFLILSLLILNLFQILCTDLLIISNSRFPLFYIYCLSKKILAYVHLSAGQFLSSCNQFRMTSVFMFAYVPRVVQYACVCQVLLARVVSYMTNLAHSSLTYVVIGFRIAYILVERYGL